ncbi:F-box only protein 7-like [Agrilus planipennis]|uniref:F-box only protein 7-like n=1 Tax=Agrilus planipennis TaxID=224129 RepID=A0A1W4XKA1_AGRPL|nr:F-box only protein 7-like [Agrilus planipennis]
MEPLLLCDSSGNQVPKSLLNVLAALSSEEAINASDVLVGLIYILMLETGFVTTDIDAPPEECLSSDFHYHRFLRCTTQLPKNWIKNVHNYNFSFILLPYRQHICHISCIPVCEDIIVNCTIEGINSSHLSILIDPFLYVLKSSEGVKWRFQNLKSLSLYFKNEISYPAKMVILQNNNVGCACLQNLPVEVLLNIVKYLDGRALYKFKEVCKYFKEVCLSDRIYKKMH